MSEKALAALSSVIDPELRRPITELGMVGDIEETGNSVSAVIKLTIVGCPAAQAIERDVTSALQGVYDAVQVTMTTMNAEERDVLKAKLRGNKPIRHNPFAVEGSLTKVPLATARELAQEYRETAQAGGDPSKERKERLKVDRPPPSFLECAKGFHAENSPTWKNKKHAAQVLATLETYAAPFFGDKPVDQVTGADVRAALIAIWLEKPETARRVRQRISAAIDWATASGFREATL
ncbi:MAG: DUF59 domain-containing protein, partial [Actinobacteria bacterium]|nr:DUF59 domain-containing protein [Actinomycetota bacterium]